MSGRGCELCDHVRYQRDYLEQSNQELRWRCADLTRLVAELRGDIEPRQPGVRCMTCGRLFEGDPGWIAGRFIEHVPCSPPSPPPVATAVEPAGGTATHPAGSRTSRNERTPE